MDVESFRAAEGWSLERLASELGFSSKGHAADLISGRQTWTLELALRMQLVSAGQVLARDLVPADKRELLDQLNPAQAARRLAGGSGVKDATPAGAS